MLSYSIYRNKKSIKWVTFIHGAGGSSAIWFKQVRVFSKFFNVLLIDLRGHGNSKSFIKSYRDYTFDGICIDIIEVLDFEKIKKSNFVGISLGTILIRNIAKINPDRVVSMILGGAILDLNFKSKLLMKIANWTKKILPYMFIYKVLSFVVMPKQQSKRIKEHFYKRSKKTLSKRIYKVV